MRILISIMFLLVLTLSCSSKRNEEQAVKKNIKIELLSDTEIHKLASQYSVERESNSNYSELIPTFPTHDILDCANNTLDSRLYKNHRNCPICGSKSESLTWIQFSSPASTWENLCGRSGPLSICQKCKIPVEFVVELMN